MTRTLGLDIGDRWIGVALSDPAGVLASPVIVLERKAGPADVQAVVDIIKKHEVGRVIVGLPRTMSGTIGAQAEKVKAFVQALAGVIDVAVEFRDERLSTVSARRMIKEAGAKRSKRKSRDDAVAAAIILQGYLDETRC